MSTGQVSATKGALQRLREQIKFTEKSKDVLKMKRDQLAGEINRLLHEIQRRKEIEKMFSEAYESVKYAYAVEGYDEVSSIANAADLLEVRANPVSVMNVLMPEVEVVRRGGSKQIPSITLFVTTEKLIKAIEEAINLAIVEAKIEQLAKELMETNRKVNALEKVIMPRYISQAKYIEDRLIEEDLEEFSATKHVRDIIRERRE
ncbi:MAG: V-type ATP synthase subunit D [Nitrososphaeria archaeon]